jgi:hypothetical protein
MSRTVGLHRLISKDYRGLRRENTLYHYLCTRILLDYNTYIYIVSLPTVVDSGIYGACPPYVDNI